MVTRAFAMLVLACAPVLTAAAQEPRDSAIRADTARKLRAVQVTETRSAAAPGGASAVVIKTEQLRASPAPLLEEALRESPFVHVRQNSRGEMELSVRGSDSRQAAVLVDGVPVSLGWDHRTDPSLIPITGAQNLVIVRGLASVLTGPNTLGGSIEVSSEDAFGRLGTGRLWGGAGVDENAAYVTALGAGRELQAISGTLALRGGVARRERDGFSLPSGAPDPTAVDGLRTNSDLLETDAFASARWRGGSGRALGLMVSGFNAERGVPPEEHLAAPRLWRYPFNTRAMAAFSANAGTFATPLGFGTLELGAGYNSGRLKIETYSDRTYTTVASAEYGDERTLSGRALFTHSLPRDGRLKAAITGADITYKETLPATAAADYEQILWSGGAEIEQPLTTRLALATGIVFDRSTTPRTGGRTPGQEAFDNVGWRAGLTHDLSTEARVHAGVSRRSRFPALRELYSGAMNRFMPNPDLKPETLLGFEGGVTLDRSFGPVPDATVQISGFHHNLDDAVVRITLPAPDRRFRRINRDRIVSTGIEALAGLAFGEHQERSVSLTGDLVVQKIRIFDETVTSAPSRHAENNPELRGMLELGVPLPLALRGFANARHTGTQYCLNADSGNEMTLSAETEANLALERRFFVSRNGAVRGVRALLALDNAANTTIYDQCGLPQPGRTLRLMFSLQ